MQKKYAVSFVIVLIAVIAGFFISLQKPVTKSNTLAASLVATDTSSTPPTQIQTCAAANEALVTKVIDGDTIVVEDGQHVRLIGIDTDEQSYPCYSVAKNRLEALVLYKKVTLKKDVSDVDQYGRCLRTIFIGDQNINLQLVKEGLAVARFYQPDVMYKDEISAAEKLAIDNKIGCKWSH